jgi:hypothetical protein
MTLVARDVRLPSQSRIEVPADRDDPARPGAGFPPAFKPVALPALAAAVRSAYREPPRKSTVDFPTILRISAMLD